MYWLENRKIGEITEAFTSSESFCIYLYIN